jgi:hypothetical protein
MDTKSMARAMVLAHRNGSKPIDQSFNSPFFKAMTTADQKEVVRIVAAEGLDVQEGRSIIAKLPGMVGRSLSNTASLASVPVLGSLIGSLWMTRGAPTVPGQSGLLYSTIKKALPSTLALGGVATLGGTIAEVLTDRARNRNQADVVGSLRNIKGEDDLNLFMLTGHVPKPSIVSDTLKTNSKNILMSGVDLAPTKREVNEYYKPHVHDLVAKAKAMGESGDTDGYEHSMTEAEKLMNYIEGYGK